MVSPKFLGDLDHCILAVIRKTGDAGLRAREVLDHLPQTLVTSTHRSLQGSLKNLHDAGYLSREDELYAGPGEEERGRSRIYRYRCTEAGASILLRSCQHHLAMAQVGLLKTDRPSPNQARAPR